MLSNYQNISRQNSDTSLLNSKSLFQKVRNYQSAIAPVKSENESRDVSKFQTFSGQHSPPKSQDRLSPSITDEKKKLTKTFVHPQAIQTKMKDCLQSRNEASQESRKQLACLFGSSKMSSTFQGSKSFVEVVKTIVKKDQKQKKQSLLKKTASQPSFFTQKNYQSAQQLKRQASKKKVAAAGKVTKPRHQKTNSNVIQLMQTFMQPSSLGSTASKLEQVLLKRA